MIHVFNSCTKKKRTNYFATKVHTQGRGVGEQGGGEEKRVIEGMVRYRNMIERPINGDRMKTTQQWRGRESTEGVLLLSY